jgi:predicted nucleotidyltransferase
VTIEPTIALDFDREAIEAFCSKWRITELSLFGSVLQLDEFRDDSDVDFLVTFEEAAGWTLFELVEMQDELKSIVGRDVDLVEKSVVERSPNYIRRRQNPRKPEDVLCRARRTSPTYRRSREAGCRAGEASVRP